MGSKTLLLALLVLAVLYTVEGEQWCYRCMSSQAGCGSPLNIRLQRWGKCPDHSGSGDNFCVKVIEKIGSEEYITRDCLDTLMRSTPHRKAMPTVRRHGYCLPSRMNLADPSAPHTRYCFCNDFNGCNSGTGIKARVGVVLSLAVVSTVLLKFL